MSYYELLSSQIEVQIKERSAIVNGNVRAL